MGRTNVVIVRKDKRVRKLTHLALFAVTGGASAPFTAVRAAQVGAYNTRTAQLQAEADGTARGWRPWRRPKRRAERVKLTAQEREYLRQHVPAAAKR